MGMREFINRSGSKGVAVERKSSAAGGVSASAKACAQPRRERRKVCAVNVQARQQACVQKCVQRAQCRSAMRRQLRGNKDHTGSE